MSHRMWPVYAVVATLSLAAAAAAQYVPESGQGPLRNDLPFANAPDRLPGPPRAMGEIPTGESQPPSTLPGGMFAQPPRAMGEAPVVSPFYPYFPSGIPGAAMPILPPFGPWEERLTSPRMPLFLPPSPTAPAVPPELPPALPEGGTLGPSPAPLAVPPGAGPPLSLEEVLSSSLRTYPLFQAVLEERNIAEADILSALGAFDLNFNSDSRNYPLGFYRRSVQDIFLEQPIGSLGGEIFSGYRFAEGSYPIYYNYLNTLGGGAFVNGFKIPLLKNRAIDGRRAKLFQSEIERRKVEPTILKERISLIKNASKVYWNWVAAGQTYMVYQALVQLVEARNRALAEQVKEQLARPIDLDSFRLVVLSRQQQLITARRDYQEAAIELSLFLRDGRCLPMLPDAARLPRAFPAAAPPEPSQIAQDIEVALRLRPEILSLRLQARKTQVDRDYAENQLLPSLSLYVYTEQNVGPRKPDLRGDFRPFIMEASLLLDVPLQRRYAKGRIQAADAVLRQLAMQTQFAADRIRADVQEATAVVVAAFEQLQRYREYEALTRKLQLAEQTLFREGGSTLLNVYIREQATADAEVLRIGAEAKFLAALAEYRAALGLDAVPPDAR